MRLETLEVTVADGVATVAIDHPPLNLYDAALHRDLGAVLDALEPDPDVRVYLLESRDPDFFVAHYDVEALLAEATSEPRAAIGPFTTLMQRLGTSEKVSIGKVRGAARGGGCELLLALDLRFAARGRAAFAFPEVALGILAAGGGTQRLPCLIGRARALELLLGGDDLDAEAAERYGLINRAVDDEALDAFVDGLARRLAARPLRVIGATKLATAAAGAPTPSDAGFTLEAQLLAGLEAHPDSRARLRRFIVMGGQTRAGEADFAALLRAVDELP